MFYLKNQIIFIVLFCIFSNFISTLNGKDANVDEGECAFSFLKSLLAIRIDSRWRHMRRKTRLTSKTFKLEVRQLSGFPSWTGSSDQPSLASEL